MMVLDIPDGRFWVPSPITRGGTRVVDGTKADFCLMNARIEPFGRFEMSLLCFALVSMHIFVPRCHFSKFAIPPLIRPLGLTSTKHDLYAHSDHVRSSPTTIAIPIHDRFAHFGSRVIVQPSP